MSGSNAAFCQITLTTCFPVFVVPCGTVSRLSVHFTSHAIDISYYVVVVSLRSTSRVVAFCVSRRRREMYCGHALLCVCLSVCVSVCLSAAVHPHYCTDQDVTWGRGRGCPLVVHYWADFQSVHRLRCYGNITRTLVYAGCATVRALLISDRRVTEAFSTLRAVYRKWAWLAGR